MTGALSVIINEANTNIYALIIDIGSPTRTEVKSLLRVVFALINSTRTKFVQEALQSGSKQKRFMPPFVVTFLKRKLTGRIPDAVRFSDAKGVRQAHSF
jgi:hypothetical protein